MTTSLDSKAPPGVLRETMTAYGRKELSYIKERLTWRGFKIKQIKMTPSFSLYDRPKYVVIGEKLNVKSILEIPKKSEKTERKQKVYHLKKLAKPKYVNSDKYRYYRFSG